MSKQYVVIAYDVASNKRRNALVKLLKGYGIRVNYSVFECRIRKSGIFPLKKKIEAIINSGQDSVLYYFLCGKCADQREQSGIKKEKYDTII